MSSTFYGFEIARSGIVASQYALNITGHNITNADTDGYTRQRLDTASISAVMGMQRLASTRAAIGGGVRVNGVEQIRDNYLDKQFREENSKTAYMSTLTTGLEDIETMFDALSDTNISKTLSGFLSSLQDLANNATDYEIRAEVQSKALELTSSFNYYYTKLQDQQAVYDESVNTVVAKINELGESIAELNKNIHTYELSGQTANDLRDQRNLMLDQLSGLIQIQYTETATNGLTIQIDGRDFVSNAAFNKLSTTQTGNNPLTGTSDLNEVVWESDGASVDVAAGSLKAIMQLRDGNTQSEYGIAYMGGQINKLVNALVTQINTAHRTGWTLPNSANGNTSATGVNFFDDFGGGQAITAGNFSLSAEILASPYNIAASDTEITDTNAGNNKNALSLVAMANSNAIPDIESFQGFLTSTVSNLGIAVSYSKSMTAMQQALLKNKENSRISVSGVSIDEEVANLIKFQHCYAASARMMTTIDEMLDLMINRMGVVGR